MKNLIRKIIKETMQGDKVAMIGLLHVLLFDMQLNQQEICYIAGKHFGLNPNVVLNTIADCGFMLDAKLTYLQ